MKRLLSDYRWELWLFFVAPAIASAVALGTIYAIPSSDSTGFRYMTRSLSYYIAWLVLMGTSYRWVSRSGRDLLRLAWQYSLAAAPLWIAYTLTITWIYGSEFEWIGFGEGERNPAWLTLLWWAWHAMALVILVCLARWASRNGFDKALVLIGVVAFPGIDFFAAVHTGGAGYFPGVTALKALLSFIAIWALHNGSAGKGVGWKGIGVLFAAAVVAYGLPYAALDIENSVLYDPPILGSFYNWMYKLIPVAACYGVAILAAYLLRVRISKEGCLPQKAVGPPTLL